MVGAAKRPPAETPRLEPAGRDGRDLCSGQGLRLGHRRQDAGQSQGQHALARPGRTDQQQIVCAGGGDRQGPLGTRLAAHIGQIAVGRGIDRRRRDMLERLQLAFAGEKAHQLGQVVHRVAAARRGSVAPRGGLPRAGSGSVWHPVRHGPRTGRRESSGCCHPATVRPGIRLGRSGPAHWRATGRWRREWPPRWPGRNGRFPWAGRRGRG